MRKVNLFVKRLIDLLGSVIGLLIISPILLIIALSIKLTSKGPIFFRQERLGKDGKAFKIVKFRTMVVNAEYIGEGLRVSSQNDSRITNVGKILRASSLDELPQLWNIIIGQMSLVGPRPPVTYFPYKEYKNYPEWAKQRFLMRPGVTGLTQVTVRNSVSWDERIAVDNEYINNFNVWLDIKTIFKTLIKVFQPENIYLKANKEVAKKVITTVASTTITNISKEVRM